MANVRSANTFYVDSASTTAGGTLSIPNIVVTAIVASATAANAVLILKDVTTGNAKLDIRIATAGDSQYFDFSEAPVVFPNGIDPATVTNMIATCVIRESRS